MNVQNASAAGLAEPEGTNGTRLKIRSEQHCFRTLSGHLVDSVTAARAHMSHGAEVQAVQVTLRHPEICIFDVSNPSPALMSKSAQDISELCAVIRGAAAHYCEENPIFTLITGDGLDAEICLSGPSKDDLVRARSQI